MKLNILAIETSTDACSVALAQGHDIQEIFNLAPQQHAKIILPLIEELLKRTKVTRQQLDAIAFGRGPGSFTGLRLGAGIAQGLAFGLTLPVIGVSSLQALARLAYREFQAKNTLAAIDARKGEIYLAQFQENNQQMNFITEEILSAPQLPAIDTSQTWHVVGSGFDHYQPQLLTPNPQLIYHPDCYPHAQDVAKIALEKIIRGEAGDPANAQPVYLRNKVTD
ncbi:MAG: tRNA (adenosine(37)-N6)-threonylcarbamoyltransferase complex dimerization subunit type 1 TsaB [Legionellales bacterium]|nr:tRNA (adenosine(37)-N6)-threonylcarbamoyltransferase complex dimerization subunit type 1 TsaB [Legionellales bacterium]